MDLAFHLATGELLGGEWYSFQAEGRLVDQRVVQLGRRGWRQGAER